MTLQTLWIATLVVSITLGTFIILEILKLYKIEVSQLKKKLITGIVGVILCFVWYYFNIDKRIDSLILSFFAAVGFYDIIIKTIIKGSGGSNDTESDTGTR